MADRVVAERTYQEGSKHQTQRPCNLPVGRIKEKEYRSGLVAAHGTSNRRRWQN